MRSVRSPLTALAAFAFLSAATSVSAEPSSGWSAEGGAQVRLVAGERAADGSLRAGLEIRLEPGWKTYWINPGPTGVPPRLDFAGSANLKKAEPLWPAPVRLDDGGTDSVGYSGHVVVPLRIEPEQAGKPIALKLGLDYGVCEKICIPARAELALTLDPEAAPDLMAAAQIRGFEKRTPVPAKLGASGAGLAITALAKTERGLGVHVSFPDGAEVTDLFAAAKEGAVGVPVKTAPGVYRITWKSAPARLDLVAVADGAAIRVPVALDGPAATP